MNQGQNWQSFLTNDLRYIFSTSYKNIEDIPLIDWNFKPRKSIWKRAQHAIRAWWAEYRGVEHR